MSGIFGAIGSIAGAALTSKAMKDVANMQIKAAKEQRDYVNKMLDTGTISAEASAADVQRAKSQLALQAITDPELLKTRYAAEKKLGEQFAGIDTGAGDQIAKLAAESAIGTSPKFAAIKEKLLDAAIDDLDRGATLPDDIQAEIVKAGLERAGTTGVGPSAKGLAGELSKKLIGGAALDLQTRRRSEAQGLTSAAQALENNRTQILASLFPALKSNQLANLSASSGILGLSESMKSDVGLSGTNIANIWLAKVGATNQLMSQASNASAQAATETAKAWSSAIGNVAGAAGTMDWTKLLGLGGSSAAASKPAFDWTNPTSY